MTGGLGNTGTLNFDTDDGTGGSTVSIAGTLTDTGKVVIGNTDLSAATTVTAGGLNEQSTLTLIGSATAQATLNVTSAAPSTLTTTIKLTRNALLEFSSGSFSSIAAGASLTLDGGAAIVADSNNVNASGALSGLTSLAGTLSLLNGTAVSTTGNLANTGSLQIDQSGNSVGASSLSVAGTLDNATGITIGNGNLSAQAKLTAGALINEGGGTITVSAGANGATAALTVQGNLSNAGDLEVKPGGFIEAGSLANAGILNLTGSAGAPTNFGVIGNSTNSGAISIGSSAELGVTGTLTNSGNMSIAGTLDVANGLTVTSTGSILLQGGSIIDPPAGTLTINAGAELTGNGSVSEPIVNNGTITAAGGLLALNGPITGNGQLNIGVGATLELGGATGETVSFGGNIGTLKIDNPASFTGTISGLAAGDVIDVDGLTVTSAVVNGSTLTLTAGGQTFNYQVAGAGLTGNVFALENDGHGGTILALGKPAPVIFSPKSQTVFTGLAAVLGPISIADPSAGNSSLTITLSDNAGIIDVSPIGSGTVGGNDTNTVTLTGDLNDINAMLVSLFYFAASAGTDMVSVTVTDAGGQTAAQNISVTTEDVPFTTSVINAPPVVPEPVVLQKPTALSGISISDPYAASTGVQIALTAIADPGSGTFDTTGSFGGNVFGQGTNVLAITATLAQINDYLADPIEWGLLSPTQRVIVLSLISNVALKAGTTVQEAVTFAEEVATSLIVKYGSIESPTVGILVKENKFYPIREELQQLVQGEIGNGLVGENLINYESAAVVDGVAAKTAAEAPPVYVMPPPSGGGFHIISADGLFYDLNAEGEFLFAGSSEPSDAFQVQIRLSPLNGGTSASVITQVAALVGSDRVTIGLDRGTPVWIDGIPSALSLSAPVSLNGGQIIQLSSSSYQISWNTGEVLTVTDLGSHLDVQVSYPAGDAPGSIVGLVGPSGEASSQAFTLPDGTVLPQPLTNNELYQVFADAWRVPQQLSLFDYGPGQSTATFTDTNFPEAAITLADLPADVVAKAAQVVAAFGVTDTNTAAAAEFDYLASGGDLSFVVGDQNAFRGSTASPAPITPSGPTPAVLGVIPNVPSVAVAQTGTTPVTFEVYLTANESSNTEVDYVVIAPSSNDLGASEFGGALPSGKITLAAGQMSGAITIDVPQDALGSLSSANLAVQISTPTGIPIFAASAQATLLAPQPGTPPVPRITYLTQFGNFTQDANHPNSYTLDLGAVQLGENIPALQFAIANESTAPSDQLTGTFTVANTFGFTVTGDQLPAPLAAGQSYDGLTVSINQKKFGGNSETITFNPVDTNLSGFSAPLPQITLTIADTLEVPGMVYSQAWGDVHIITYNGLKYDFQASGDYVLAKSRISGDSFQIQLELEPWFTGASVTTIHAVAIALGADRVTFDWTRGDTVLVDGAAPSGLSMGTPLTLAGGTITEISPNMYKVDWATGETMTVSQGSSFVGSFINVTDGIPGNAGPEAYAGLQGENAGTQNDFQLADGTVLAQPLTTSELYGIYAHFWEVTQATSLFDGPVIASAPPADPVTLADVPQDCVTAAKTLAAAAGITDPGIADAAALDFAMTGDPSFLDAAANIQQQLIGTTPANIFTPTPAVAAGVMAEAQKVTEAASGPTPVTFHVCMTGTETTDSVFTYQVIAPGTGFLGAAAFGGTLPSGAVTIAAGQTEEPFIIDVPQGALGSNSSDNLEVQISNSSGIPIFAPTAQTEIVNNQPEPGNAAIPMIAKVSGPGTLTYNSPTHTYTLALGGLVAGTSLDAVQLAVVNANTAPGDSLGGTFTPPTGTGFIVTGNNIPHPIKPGQNYQGLYVSLNNFAYGANTMIMQLAPTDVNDSGYSAALPTITLNITDSITPPAKARLNTPSTIIFPNVRVGTPETQKLSITQHGDYAGGEPRRDGHCKSAGNCQRLDLPAHAGINRRQRHVSGT